MVRRVVWVVGILALGVAAVAAYAWAGPRVVAWRLARADPEADADRALARRDYRLVALKSYSLYAPGAGADEGHVEVGWCLARVVPFSSDVVSSPADERLAAVAEAYAARYNRRLLARAGRAAVCPRLPPNEALQLTGASRIRFLAWRAPRAERTFVSPVRQSPRS